MPDILFSIVTPTWNSMTHIKETVHAVMQQTCGDWEWIFADDSSTDGTVDFLKELAIEDSRIKLIELEKTNNPAVSRNICIRKASGKVICFLDHDDFWDKSYLEEVKEAFLNDSVQCVFTKHNFKNSKGIERALSYPFEGGVIDSSTLIRWLFVQNRIALSAFSIDSSFIKKIGLMSESEKVWASCDYELYLRALRNRGKFNFVNLYLLNYRVQNSSMSSNHERNIQNRIYVLQKIRNDSFFRPFSDEIDSLENKCNFQLSIASFFLKKPDWRKELITAAYKHYGFSQTTKLIRWVVVAMFPWKITRSLIKSAHK